MPETIAIGSGGQMDNPRITFKDEAIKKYTGQEVDDFNIDEVVTLTVKCKVKSVEKYKDRPWVNGKESKKEKTVSRLEMEVVGGGEDDGDAVDKYFKKGPGEK